MPQKLAGKKVIHMLSFIYEQMKPMISSSVDTSKLYLTTGDGFFLPPNTIIDDILTVEN